jgi:predicted RNase H-like nuclease
MSKARIGVDGCKAGWLFVRSFGDQVDFGVVKQLAELVPTEAESAKIFVDIPIGLRDTSGEPRTCDRSARKVLGRRGSSVFPAPLRVVLQCTSHTEANVLAGKSSEIRISRH